MRITLLTLAASLIALPVLADETATTPTDDVKDALEAKADVPATPPTLPTQASDRATYVHANIAFGKKGAAERAAHSQAGVNGQDAAQGAAVDPTTKAAQGIAASTARSANADAHAAAGQAQAGAVRNSHASQVTPGPASHPGR